jgi:hypothetical protein
MEPPRRPKGHHPQYFEQPAVDQLHAAVLALASELAVAFDRIDALERLLAASGALPAGAIDAYKPDEAAVQVRSARHADIAERLLRPFREYREDLFARAEPSAGVAKRQT